MSEFCYVVPWYDSEEWLNVYENISGDYVKKQHALNLLLVWKARCPSLPSGIESTLSLLEVYVQDIKQGSDVVNDQLIRLAYSSAIMRFVNHMLDKETEKGSSLYKAAKNLGVPDWIVDLRHDTAHSNNLPNIKLLREACSISLEWLQQNYWDKYKPEILDYISGSKYNFDGDENKITALINLCTVLSICAHPSCKIKNLSDIPYTDMRDAVVNDVKDLLIHVDLSNLKTVSIFQIINIMQKENKYELKASDAYTYVNKAILGDDSVFLSKELLYFFTSKYFKYKNKLHTSYVQCFEVLLNFLHTNDLLLEFILELIKISQNSESPPFQARLSALWVAEILQALKTTQEFSLRIEKMTDNHHSKTKKDLKQLYRHWYPSNKGHGLILNFQKPIPAQLSDINFIQPIIAAYNPYLVYFVKNLLDLIQPSIPTPVAERVYKLAELISSPEKFTSTTSTIYTEDDIKMANDNDEDIVITGVFPAEEISASKDQQQNEPQVTINSGIWKLASKDHNWSSCPIGILPWQQANNDVIMTPSSESI